MGNEKGQKRRERSAIQVRGACVRLAPALFLIWHVHSQGPPITGVWLWRSFPLPCSPPRERALVGPGPSLVACTTAAVAVEVVCTADQNGAEPGNWRLALVSGVALELWVSQAVLDAN